MFDHHMAREKITLSWRDLQQDLTGEYGIEVLNHTNPTPYNNLEKNLNQDITGEMGLQTQHHTIYQLV